MSFIPQKILSSEVPQGASEKFYLVFSEEENHWVSLIEANQKVISFWKSQETSHLKLEVVNLSSNSNSIKKFLNAKFIVISKITRSTAFFIKQMKEFRPDLWFVFHGLESSSIYFANTCLYGLEPLLKENDLWIMSCEADEKLAQESWKNIQTTVIPLAIPESQIDSNSERDFLYIGRISVQKNLHEALLAVSLMQDEFRTNERKFKIFGYEDNLGVPHLKISGRGYLRLLKKLVKKLGIADIVIFGRFLNEEEINQELRSGILLSPSIHSDENFGLVAFRALSRGHKVILSAWGGHRDYEKYFTNVYLVPVYETKNGLHLNPFELVQQMRKALHSQSRPVAKKYDLPAVVLRDSGNGLTPTELKEKFNKRLHGLHAWPYYGKLFRSFHDPLFLLASKIYGAIPLKKFVFDEKLLILSTVNLNKDWLILSDPRGKRLKMRRTSGERLCLKKLGKKKRVKISQAEAQWLWDNGGIMWGGDHVRI